MTETVRLDKWLWAARFFRSRSLAKQAIESGRIHYDGARVKVSKEVRVGAELRIRQGREERTVEVTALSDQRRGAPQAALLYRETAASVAAREHQAEQRRFTGEHPGAAAGRPSKRDRRRLDRFSRQLEEHGDPGT